MDAFIIYSHDFVDWTQAIPAQQGIGARTGYIKLECVCCSLDNDPLIPLRKPMSNEKQPPSSPPPDLIYVCSNKDFYNTTITSPDGRTSYIIEALVKPPRRTLYIVTRDKEGEGSTRQEVATITWKACKPDLVTFANQEPIRVKDLFPKRWYTL